MPAELIDLNLEEVSFVDAPANKGSRVILLKRDEEADMPEDISKLKERVEKLENADLTKALEEAVKAEGEEAKAQIEKLEAQVEAMEKDARIKELEDTVKGLQEKTEKGEEEKAFRAKLSPAMQKAFDEMEEEERRRFMDKFSKLENDDDPVTKAMTKLEKDNEDLRKKVDSMEQNQRLSDLQKELEVLEGYVDVTSMAKAYSVLEKGDADAAKVMIDALKSIAKQAKEAGLFKVIGQDGQGDGSAESKLDKAVQKYMTEHTDVDKATAEAKVLEEQPELYKEYNAEKAGGQ